MKNITEQERRDYIDNPEKLIKDAKSKKNKNVEMYSTGYIPARRNGKIPSTRQDGWLNLFTGMGTSQDKSMHTTFSGYQYLDDAKLTQLWVGDGFAKKISKAPADDMTREWVKVADDVDNNIDTKLNELHAQKEFNHALLWKRHFGGSVIVMGINDGNEITEPVNPNTIKSVDWLRVYDRTDVSLTSMNFTADPNEERYGKPVFYTITPKYTSIFNVHWSRVIEFKGLPVPSRADGGQFWYWGMSVLQPIWQQVADMAAAERNVSKLLYEFVIGKYKIKGLAQLMAEDNWQKVKQIMDTIDLGKSMIQAILLDADGDDYVRDSANVSGLPELLDRFMMFLSGVSEIPVTRLFGRSAAGMNATGDGDEKNYYNGVRSEQITDMIPAIQLLVDYINLSQEITQKATDPVVRANPLFQETQEEIIVNRKTQSEIDRQYWDMGVLAEDEIRESRFANGYSFDTELQEDSGFGLEQPKPEKKQVAAEEKAEENE